MNWSSPLKLVTAIGICSCVGFALAQGPGTTNQNVSVPRDDSEVRALFDAKCAKCHGKDGRAKTFAGRLKDARNLSDDRWQGRVTDERILDSIRNGRSEMPAFNKKLTDSQIASLAAYVRNFKNGRQAGGTH